jgi:hypothetical protein
MPFQSEKQRRYLWANEPEIARDWTDTYGSRISKDNGGIADLLYGDTLGYGIERPEYLSQNVSFPNILKQTGQFYRYPEEEQEENSNWAANLRSYGMPAYNFMRGKIGAGLLGLWNPLTLLGTMFAGRGQGIGNFANTMRGGLTQSGFEQAREARRRQARIDNMLARKAANKSYSQKNLNQLTMGSRPGHYDSPGGNGGVQGTSSPAEPGGWHPGV